jgi:phage shock protein E
LQQQATTTTAAAAAAVDTVLLDVRNAEEINVDGTFQPKGRLPCYNIPCTLEDVEMSFRKQAPTILPAIIMDTPIIVYCKSGRRAAKAKQTLIEMGFTNVMNAGGYSDINKLCTNNKNDVLA